MTEYIDREQALYELCNNSIPVFDENGDILFVCDYITVLNSIPAADVVEVVRCKDCRRFVQNNDECPWDDESFLLMANDYCSRGECKECKEKRADSIG